MNIEEMRSAMRSYDYEQEVIKRIIRRHGKITASQFDDIFSDSKTRTDSKGYTIRTRRSPRYKVRDIHDDTPMLGGMTMSLRNLYLDVTQHMAVMGDVDIYEKNDTIYYELAQ